MTRTGFSLLELLVVLAVVLVLTGMIIPAMASVREQANRMVCSSNMRQIGIATLTFTYEYDELPSSRYADDRENVQDLMAAHSGEGQAWANWQGFGWLYAWQFLDNPEVFYCPSHHGEHTYDRYASRYHEYYDLYAIADGEIFTNYQYAGATDWTEEKPSKRDLLDPELVLATDGLRTWNDFNHIVGMNVLRADISVNWREDKAIFEIRSLLMGQGGQGIAAYEDIWNIVDP